MGIIKKFYITKFKKERPKIELKNISFRYSFAVNKFGFSINSSIFWPSILFGKKGFSAFIYP